MKAKLFLAFVKEDANMDIVAFLTAIMSHFSDLIILLIC